MANVTRMRFPTWSLFVCSFVLWSWFGAACGTKCALPMIEVDGTCVVPANEKNKESIGSEKRKESVHEGLLEPKSEPKVEPKSEPKSEPKVEPKAEPKSEPKPEPKVEPKAEPKPEPNAPDEPAIVDAGIPEPVKEVSGPTPSVQITAPKNAGVVFGEITIKVDANVATGASIDKVELQVDGKWVYQWSKSPYEYKFKTSSLKDGKHKLTAIAYTDLGKKKQDEIEVTFANAGPAITILSPKPSAGVSGSFTIEATVKAAQGLKMGSVKLEIDGVSVAWSQTTPSYQATFDPKGKPYNSFPIAVTATNLLGKTNDAEVWVIFEPPVGTKKSGEECDNSDATKRCIKGHSCLALGSGASPKAICHKNCVVGGASSQCFSLSGRFACQVVFQWTTRGICASAAPRPGQLFSSCGNLKNQKCQTSSDCKGTAESCIQGFCTVTCTTPGTLCVGAQKRPDGRLISYCVKTCTTPNRPCSGASGFLCVGLSSGGGACIEQCGQSCSSDANCSKGQKCTSGTCSTPFCSNYGKCTSLQGLSSKLCI